jgi:hypothetical protein
MYVVKTTNHRHPDGRYTYSDYLIEVTAKELREIEADAPSHVEYNRVTAEMARRYVKQGMTHMTPLWVDFDGKVKYARDGI